MAAKTTLVSSRNIKFAKYQLITSIAISTGSNEDGPSLGRQDQNDETNYTIPKKGVADE
jgi:hypothetical protein